jgi:outer membrane protein assembly factor BamB
MTRGHISRSLAVCCLALALLLSGCQVDWATWGFGVERQGYNPAEATIGASNVAQLRHQWSVNLGAYINASPVVATRIDVGGTPTDVVYVGTEHGVFFAVSTAGQILWYRDLGSIQTDCPDTPDSKFGVSASAIFDREGNRVLVAGGDGYFYALDPATGAILPGWPVRITADPVHEVVFSAPTLFGDRVYVEFASHCDTRPYHGRIVGINTTTGEKTVFWVTGSRTGPDGGGIWGWGGVSVDPVDGNVYAATGNAFGSPENSFYADHVVRLTRMLNVKASHAPGTSIIDDDFGSTPVLFQKSGCPPQLVTEQKNGYLYLYNRDAIATGFHQRIHIRSDGEFIGVPAYSPDTQMVYVANQAQAAGSPYTYGMLAFTLNAKCKLKLAWQTTAGANDGIPSTPTIANGVVYYSDGFSPGHIHAFDASTGAQLWESGAEVAGGILATPIVVNGQLFASSYDNHLHAWGP